MTLNPFNLPGEPFLILYGILFAAALAAGFAIPRWLRPEGRAGPVTGEDRLAYLAGGRARYVDAVVSRLLAGRSLALVGRDKFYPERRDAGRDAAERGVLALAAPASWSAVEKAVRPHGKAVERRLVAAGLLMEGRHVLQLRYWQTAPFLPLLIFGLAKAEVGTVRERPVGLLTAPLIATAVCAVVRWAIVDRRTRAGQKALARARADADRLRRAPTTEEMGLAVALFGTAVLAGSPLADFHQLRQGSGDGGGSSDGSSGDGGGCGGGGCGGCGG